MLRNYWLEQVEAEYVAYFMSNLFKPLNARFLEERWKKSGLLDGL
jgi:hypothetical protein